MNISAQTGIQRAQKYAKYFSYDSMHTDSSQHLFVCMYAPNALIHKHAHTHNLIVIGLS